jgi:hypothetical protein
LNDFRLSHRSAESFFELQIEGPSRGSLCLRARRSFIHADDLSSEGYMQMIQRYMLTIHDLFTATDGGICGAEAEVAILDGGVEMDRVKLLRQVPEQRWLQPQLLRQARAQSGASIGAWKN